MKSIPYYRLLTAAFLFSLLTPSLGHSQNHAQMDSMYAVMQRLVLETYPTALFPPIPYDQYAVVTNEHNDGTVGITWQLAEDSPVECLYMFPEYDAWKVDAKEAESDPTAEMEVMIGFYLADADDNSLQEGLASAVLVRKQKKSASAPNEYEQTDPDEGVIIDGYPHATESFQCETYLGCVPADHPLHALIEEHCPKY